VKSAGRSRAEVADRHRGKSPGEIAARRAKVPQAGRNCRTPGKNCHLALPLLLGGLASEIETARASEGCRFVLG
jgi:hypothetical protein